MDSCTVKRSRKLNWAKAEVDELRNSYLEFRSVIDGRLCIGLTNFDKEQTWRKIQERVNAQSTVHRTVEEMKKKLSDMKSALKKRERERRYQSQKTGGGPAPTMDEWDEKMIEAIGEVAVGGFCGVDTFTGSMETATIESEDTSATYEISMHTDEKKKKKNNADDDTEKVITLLKDQNTTLKLILEEQKKTNLILSQLFAVNIEP